MDGGTIFLYAILAAFPALIIFAAVYKYMEVAQASRWPKAQGRVIVSTSEARAVKSMNSKSDDTEMRTFAKIVYEFTVAGRKYQGDRVSIGEDLGNFQVAGTIAKYPRGKDVTVYYNPVKPTQSVLERDLPAGMLKGIVIIILILIGILVGAVVGFHKLGDFMSGLVRNPSEAPFVTACVGFALLVSLFIWGFQRTAARQRAWPTVSARVEKSAVHEFQELEERDSGSDRWRTMYRSEVIYGYEVAGVRYTGDMATSGTKISSNIESIALRAAEKYPVGAKIDVHYNPDNPAETAINPGSVWFNLLWLVPAAMLTLAYFIAR